MMPIRSDLQPADGDVEDGDHEGILTFAQILANLSPDAKESPAIDALKASQPVRNVELNWDSATGTYRNVKFERRSNVEALLMQATGEAREQEQQCEHCAKGCGPFAKCVTSTKAAYGACANCHYRSQGARCEHQHGTLGAKSRKLSAVEAPQDRSVAPGAAANKRGRLDNDVAPVAGTDSAGGPGPATLAFRTVNTLRAVRAANSDDSASSSDHHRDLRSFQPIASPDKKNQMDRASRHGLRQVHRDQPQAPRHTARSKDEDNETVEPRPGGHVQVSEPSGRQRHAKYIFGSHCCSHHELQLACCCSWHPDCFGSFSGHCADPCRSDLSHPSRCPPAFHISISTNLSYHDKRRMAWLSRALADAFDAAAEQELGERA